MRTVRTALSAAATLALAILLVGVGFVACVMPPVTTALSGACADDATSPFTRPQLAQVADATRAYAFGTHSKAALNRVIYQVNAQLAQRLEAEGAALPAGFPQLGAVTDPSDAAQVEAALAPASETYAFSPDTIAHLDDCHAIARVAYPLLAALAVALAAGCAACLAGRPPVPPRPATRAARPARVAAAGGASHGAGAPRSAGRRRAVGVVLRAAGGAVLVAFAAFGLFALIDFQRFFTLFHGVFFSQGNWQFPATSLLICALPTPFWAAMGAVWLGVSSVASVACLLTGAALCRHAPRDEG